MASSATESEFTYGDCIKSPTYYGVDLARSLAVSISAKAEETVEGRSEYALFPRWF